MSFSRKTKLTKKNKKALANRNESMRIPTYIPDAVFTSTFRYIVGPNVSAQVIAFQLELPIAPFGIASASDSFILPFKSVRISKIRCWQNYQNSTSISGNTASITMNDRRLVRPVEYTAIGGHHALGFIKKKFGPNDPLGQYYITGSGESNPELTFQITKGTVLEITYNWIMSDGQGCPTSAGSSLSYPRVYANRLNSDVDVVGKAQSAVISM